MAGASRRTFPLSAGSVSGSWSQFVRRTASLEFADEYAASADALSRTLSIPGCEVRVWSGITVAGRDWWLPVHWGLAESPNINWRGRSVALNSPDRAMRIAYDRFPKPRSSSAGFTVAQQIAALVRETSGSERPSLWMSPATTLPSRTWCGTGTETTPLRSSRRRSGVRRSGGRMGRGCFGGSRALWACRRCVSASGVNLADATRETDWSSVRNHWVAISDRADGTALFGESFDDDPASPTYVEGPFGRRTAFYSSSLFTTNAQCVVDGAGVPVPGAGCSGVGGLHDEGPPGRRGWGPA